MTQYIKAGKLADYEPEGTIQAFRSGPHSAIAVVKVDGKFHAFNNICPHAGYPLNAGVIVGKEIDCWGHGAAFDIMTGETMNSPVYEPLSIYDVKVDGDDVLIAVPEAQPQT